MTTYRIALLTLMQILLLTEATTVDAQNESKPPYSGTIFLYPDLIKEDDPNAFQELKFLERTERAMFDRRVNRHQTSPVFLFEATFRDLDSIEVAVNREFETVEEATEQARRYTEAFGRLPAFLRTEIKALHIQAGTKPFGGGSRVLIHTGQGERYSKDNILEETLAHEAAHALDRKHARNSDWQAAQKKDGNFISTYARDNPQREDIAESVVPFIAVRYRSDRVSEEQLKVIQRIMPARIAYFDSLNLDPAPLKPTEKSDGD